MSLLFFDGFDHYGASDEAEFGRGKWDAYQTTFVESGTTDSRRPGGRHLVLEPNVTLPGYVHKNFSAMQTYYVGLAVRFTTLVEHRCFMLYDGANKQCSVLVENGGAVAVYRGDHNGTQLDVTSGPEIAAGTWAYIEFMLTIDNSAGAYEVRIDGDVILSGSSVDTQSTGNATADGLRIYGCGSGGADLYVDDLYVSDSEFYGDCRVDCLWPDGAGSQTDFTPVPSGTSNYANVDDASDQDDDTTYNISSTVGEYDLFTLDNLTALVSATIHGVGATICALGDISTTSQIRPVAKPTSTLRFGSDVDVENTYTMGQYIWETNPDAPSVAWEESDVNGAEFGYMQLENAVDEKVTQFVVEVLRENADMAASSASAVITICC